MRRARRDRRQSARQLSDRQQKSDLRNDMRFAVTVDGKAVTPRLREVARLHGKDVTARLKGSECPCLARGEQ